jgi:NADH-quinone oxidoreductase subunit L
MPAWSLPGMEWAWLVPILGVGAFGLITLWGRHLPRGGAYVAISATGIGFLLFWFVLRDLLLTQPQSFSFTWFEVASYKLEIGMILDPLSVLMLGMVTLVALLVQVYSLGYMHGDPRFSWYFAAHSLFAASMLGLVLADNFLLLYITWELVGLCSYLLIGFWYERRSAAEAAKKAFITTRIGDVGFLIGILILFKITGTFSISKILEAASQGDIAAGTLTAVSLLIFLGAIGKSAQFPLHVWLPDAMEGPTPVSALIHAATMVAAGVYVVARTFPLFQAAPGALEVVAIIGLFTALLAATMALVMTDLKRVLAYSTISQLGFMMLALGSLGYAAGMFHLMTNAFFKALLFLGAGSVLHSTGKMNIWEMGGLRRRMPITTITFTIAALALAGLPPLSGFFSKDEILAAVYQNQSPLIFGLTLLAAFLSALYMARLLFVVFGGKLKAENEHAHESPPVMTLPMMVLGLLALVSGFAAMNWVGPLFGLPAKYLGFGSFLYLHEPEAFHVRPALMLSSTAIALLGLFAGWAIYSRGWISPQAISRRFALAQRIVVNKYYLDDLYQAITNRVVLVFSNLVALFDRLVINDRGVNGTAGLPIFAGGKLRYHQTGKLYNYGLAMAAGIVIIILTAVLV